ncbi:MAG: cache domain-containing protein [Candidatus Manganitrophus sp.]|nr:cache domain-containing protein [Candidatus Manganitrophus sp.]
MAATTEPKEIYYGNQPWWEDDPQSIRRETVYFGHRIMRIRLKTCRPMYTLSMAIPIYDLKGEGPIGVLLMVQSVKDFFELVTQVKLAKTDHTMLAGSDGNLLFCPIFLVKNHTLRAGVDSRDHTAATRMGNQPCRRSPPGRAID